MAVRSTTTMHELAVAPGAAEVLARAAASALRRPKGVPDLPREGVRLRQVAADPARLSRYRKVCGLTDRDTLPLTYPHVLAQSLHLWLLERPTFPLPLLGLVHLANRFEQKRAIAVDEALDLTVELVTSRHSERGLEFDLRTRAQRGRSAVWEGLSTYLYRLPSAKGGGKDRTAPPAPPALDLQTPIVAPANTGRRYAAVSGDFNPIHLTPITAKLFGFPRAIAHGMWTTARCLEPLASAHGVQPSSMTVRFKQPLLLPARAELRSRRDGSAVEFLLAGSGTRLHLDGTLS